MMNTNIVDNAQIMLTMSLDTHHRSSTAASFVIFCSIHNSCFYLIEHLSRVVACVPGVQGVPGEQGVPCEPGEQGPYHLL